MFAIIESGGKQFKVDVNDIVFVEKLNLEEGADYTFEKVIGIYDETLVMGRPYLTGVTVSAKVIKQGRAKKILVFHYKPKKKFHKKQGHRQPYTKLQIVAINK